MKKTEFQDFVKKASLAHNNKFKYENCGYISANKKIQLKCDRHGDFEQYAHDHVSGHGCPRCYWDDNKTWSDEDDRFLVENYKKMGAKKCGVIRDKTISAVYSRATFLGIVTKQKEQRHPHIPNHFLNNVMRHASFKDRKVEVDDDWIWELYLSQNRKCALSGRDISFSKCGEKANASLDRIDSNLDYIKDNLQLTHIDVNLSKRIYSNDYFIQMCREITDYQNSLKGI